MPWINVDDARRKGQTVEEYAAATAENWRKGLDGWGIGAERLRELQQSADFTIYTPGSDAVSPSACWAVWRRRASTSASTVNWRGTDHRHSCCASGADRRQVRTPSATGRRVAGQYLRALLARWGGPGSGKLILSIQNPPVKQLGVFDVDTYYPEKDRFALASVEQPGGIAVILGVAGG